MSFEEWLQIYKHMEIEEFEKLDYMEQMYIEQEYYREGY